MLLTFAQNSTQAIVRLLKTDRSSEHMKQSSPQ